MHVMDFDHIRLPVAFLIPLPLELIAFLFLISSPTVLMSYSPPN